MTTTKDKTMKRSSARAPRATQRALRALLFTIVAALLPATVVSLAPTQTASAATVGRFTFPDEVALDPYETFFKAVQVTGGSNGGYVSATKVSGPEFVDVYEDYFFYNALYIQGETTPDPGNFPLTVRLTDQAGNTETVTLTIRIKQVGFTLAPGTFRPKLVHGVWNRYALETRGTDDVDPASLTWNGYNLPEGTRVTQEGFIEGRPTTLGYHTTSHSPILTVSGVLRSNPSQSRYVQKDVAIEVVPQTLEFTSSATPPRPALLSLYTHKVSAKGGYGDVAWSTSGQLPPGIALVPDGRSATLTGVPILPGSWTFNVIATDSGPDSYKQSILREYTLTTAGCMAPAYCSPK